MKPISVMVRGAAGDAHTLEAAAFLRGVTARQIDPAAGVSFDGGRTFLPAFEAAARLQMRGDDALAALLPTRVETFSTLAGYVAIFSGLFFGGPLSFLAAVVGWDPGPKVAVRLAMIAAALLLGPAPPGIAALLGLRAIRRDPTLRGKGRAIFALVVTGLMLLGCLVGVGGVVITGLRG